ncbi:hypothetical protein Tco_0847700 [Tanacetum coccineum]
MQGTELSQQEHECKLYDDFDRFTLVKGESLHEYYLRFAQLMNDMHTIGMTMHQFSVDKKCFEIQKQELLLENDRLLELIIFQDLVHTAVNSLEVIDECKSLKESYREEYTRNLTLEAQLSKMNELSKICSNLQSHCISLELKLQQNKETKESSISKLRAHIATLKGKNMSDNSEPNNASVIASRTFRLDLNPLSHRLKKNKEAYEDYLQKTKENTDTLRGLVERARKQDFSDPYLDYACKFTKRVQELLVYVSKTCPSSQVERKKMVVVTPMNKTRKVRSQEPKESSSTTQTQAAVQTKQTTNKSLLSSTGVIASTSASRSQSKNNTRKNRITPGASSKKKNKAVEVHPRKFMTSSNKRNHVSMCNANFKHAIKDTNSKFVCVPSKNTRQNEYGRPRSVPVQGTPGHLTVVISSCLKLIHNHFKSKRGGDDDNEVVVASWWVGDGDGGRDCVGGVDGWWSTERRWWGVEDDDDEEMMMLV